MNIIQSLTTSLRESTLLHFLKTSLKAVQSLSSKEREFVSRQNEYSSDKVECRDLPIHVFPFCYKFRFCSRD
ncbi:hypothetical protein HanPSC8_Chr17g0747831 [Helianthus annuus]|nr:hypothetical protein HanPSC8_Chr17g0747831 [Helianthus annuus]